jgi:hypothetical protein
MGPVVYLWQISYYDDIYNAPTLATVATSGSYNDLTDKPSIPSASDFVDLTSAQTITGVKTFQSYVEVENTLYGIKMGIAPSRFSYEYDNQGTIERTLFDLPTSKTAGTEQQPTSYTLATTDDIPSLSGYATETWVGQQGFLTNVSWDIITGKPTFASVATSGSYNDLTDKPTIPSTASSTSTVTPTTQTLIFTLDDDSTVTVNVMTGVTVSTTTTLS